ncbi:cysteine hydrolase family protein [Roseateles sp. NT4]|uniref:cysteine hydrolase family protein n=1 Tax=Roseateles sp. NT4 TaxID=3453715 RepID=UPI003EEB92F7
MSKIRTHALEPSKTVLLLVDFVNPLDFDGAAALAPSALEAARQTSSLRRRLAAEGVRTVYANDNYGQWTSDFKALWQHCRAAPGIAGKIAKLMAPKRDDFVLLKPRHSAFYATPLDLLLDQLRCKRLIVTGIAADNCVLFSAMDAYLRGYSVWIPVDCVAAESAAARDSALEQMARVLKADIRPSEAVRTGR